jgi:hypothetical protein
MANKMHGVGELPMLNRLFGSQKDNAMRSIRRPDPMTAEFNSGDEAPRQAASPAKVASEAARLYLHRADDHPGDPGFAN